ncbi:hypothetical protein ACMA5I_04150 [Paracoccaceae bacterium GXU_MW_L88]
MRKSNWMLLVVLGGLVACGLALWLYFTPLSGMTGTSGAALTAFGGGAVAFGGAVLNFTPIGGFEKFMALLTGLGIIGTGVAGHFLLSMGIVIAMVFALVGLVAHLASPKLEGAHA